jgi:site-specific recombinase XerC
MIESGTQLIYIRNFLGHSSVLSTEIYARLGQEKLANMLKERGKSSKQSSAAVEKTQAEKLNFRILVLIQ